PSAQLRPFLRDAVSEKEKGTNASSALRSPPQKLWSRHENERATGSNKPFLFNGHGSQRRMKATKSWQLFSRGDTLEVMDALPEATLCLPNRKTARHPQIPMGFTINGYGTLYKPLGDKHPACRIVRSQCDSSAPYHHKRAPTSKSN
ncbi:hypothetical protein BHE74_00050764, partial [Ensete ventricosum]